MRKLVSLLTVLLITTSLTQSQIKTVSQYIDDVRVISNRADLKAADDYIDRNHESILREWIAITEINAPSGQEQQRAKHIESLLRKYHLDDIHYDSAGNLIAIRKGTGGGPITFLTRTWIRSFSRACKSRQPFATARFRRPASAMTPVISKHS